MPKQELCVCVCDTSFTQVSTHRRHFHTDIMTYIYRQCNAHDIHTRNRYKILVPGSGTCVTQSGISFFSGTRQNMFCSMPESDNHVIIIVTSDWSLRVTVDYVFVRVVNYSLCINYFSYVSYS